jgi:exodeoxyribonuclease V alpha subunit
VLRDVLAWGELEVRDLRPATTGPGALGTLAAAVRSGRLPPADPTDRSLVVVPCAEDATVVRRAEQLVADSIPRAFGVAASDIAVLAPLHRGNAGSRALTEALAGSGARVMGLHDAAWAAQPWPAVVGCFGAQAAGVVSRAMVYELALLAATHLSVVTAVGPALPEAVAGGVARQRVTLLASLLAEG